MYLMVMSALLLTFGQAELLGSLRKIENEFYDQLLVVKK